MNVKLPEVVSDVTGVTGLAILRAILAGERDPERLAALRDRRCQRSRAEIARALEGNWRAEHLFALKQALVFQVEAEDGPDPLGFRGVDHQLLRRRIDVVAEHGQAAGPLALLAGGGDLVAGALGDDLALELREGEQDVEDQTAQRTVADGAAAVVCLPFLMRHPRRPAGRRGSRCSASPSRPW
jgi:hypothetical protein